MGMSVRNSIGLIKLMFLFDLFHCPDFVGRKLRGKDE